jgi:AraC family transcriptional activator of tynA and feaB
MDNWTTSSLPVREQFDYWREVICAEYTALSSERILRNGPFRGEISSQKVAGIQVSTIRSEAQTISHGRREIASSDQQLYFLLLQTKGLAHITQGPQDFILQPGDFTLVATEHPYKLAFKADFEQLCINIPKHFLRARLDSPDTIIGQKVCVDDDLAKLGRNYLQTLQSLGERPKSIDTERLVNNFLDLLPLIFNSNQPRHSDLSRYKAVQLDTLRSFITRELANPALSPKMAADYLGVSVRYIHKVFAGSEESFGRTVLTMRLQRASEALCTPQMSHQTVADIAFKWGFNDLSYFGKCFKKQYQMTPRQWRLKQAS